MMKEFKPLDPQTERTEKEIVDAAYKVHKELGPGLLESVYEACLTHELTKRGLKVDTQIELPVHYETVRLDIGFRLDLLVENEIIVELKAVETMIPLFEAQLLTYLKLTGKRLGLLINFNVPLIKNGIKRLIL
jgi:GxxExxY protein